MVPFFIHQTMLLSLLRFQQPSSYFNYFYSSSSNYSQVGCAPPMLTCTIRAHPLPHSYHPCLSTRFAFIQNFDRVDNTRSTHFCPPSACSRSFSFQPESTCSFAPVVTSPPWITIMTLKLTISATAFYAPVVSTVELLMRYLTVYYYCCCNVKSSIIEYHSNKVRYTVSSPLLEAAISAWWQHRKQ